MKKILFVILLVLFTLGNSFAGRIFTQTLLSSVTSTGYSEVSRPIEPKKLFHLTGFVSTSTGAASVTVEASNDNVNFVVIDTLTLTLGTAVTSDYGQDTSPWKYVMANVGSISGTDAEVSLIMSVHH